MTTTVAGPVAADGIEREASRDREVHRPLIAVDPPMRGRDVANLQRAARLRLKNRGIGPGDGPVPDHGAFTAATAPACSSTSSACARTPIS